MMFTKISLFFLFGLLAGNTLCNVFNVRGLYGNYPPNVQFTDIEVNLATNSSKFSVTQNLTLIPNCENCQPDRPANTISLYSRTTGLVYVIFQYRIDGVADTVLWVVDLATNEVT
eukprot:TRINITY_DN1683_c0_g1_i2.p1 TRINITY_DN1683_c0_g1~~TRINITY_DN1683_c0_g1_i2.p1  ORF type:complete len:115 (-),score=14.62 TRINITY_DN1683_c0_g1_i2:183-527(-)